MEKNMTKFEFLGDLSRLISDLPEEDKNQAMEYYEDYFADAGPENEQEIIRDFISPEFIAQQIRNSAKQRMETEKTTTENNEIPKEDTKPINKPIFARKTAAHAIKTTQEAMQTPEHKTNVSATDTITGTPANNSPNPAIPTQNATTVSTATTTRPTTATDSTTSTSEQTVGSATTPSTEGEESEKKMRNTIFQKDPILSQDKSSEELERIRKTKIDIKSIDKNTAKVDKKKSKAEKKNNAGTSQYQATQYNSSKKALVTLLIFITCPIWLCILGVIIGLFVCAFGLFIACIGMGIVALVSSVGSLLLAIFSVAALHIPNAIYALGSALLLFVLGCVVCYLDIKFCTRVIPSAYYSITAQIKNIRSRLRQFTMK